MLKTHVLLTFILVALLCTSEVLGQNFTSSPYSRFGIGDIASQGYSRNKGMGQTGIALRSNLHINNLNPASFSVLDSTSFLFEFGGSANFYNYKTTLNEQSGNDANFEYFALAFSAKNWWGVSLGVRQISNVGYDLYFLNNNEQIGDYSVNYIGKGGVNKVYVTNSFQLMPRFSLGFSLNYNWGKIASTRQVAFAGGGSLPIFTEEKTHLGNFNVDFGAQFEGKLNEKTTYVTGATFANKTDITSNFSNFQYRTSTSDTISYVSGKSNGIQLPNTFGIGFAINKSDRLVLSMDYRHEAWESVTYFGEENLDELTNSSTLAAGFEFTPNRNSLSNYFDRVSYRGGFNYTNSYLKINDQQIDCYALTLGVGFPVKSTYINTALEFATRGKTENELVKENFVKLSVAFTMFESWFNKILYD